MDAVMNVVIREAQDSEYGILTEISLASKRYWNYPEEYFAVWKSELTISPEYIRENMVFVAEINDMPVGYFSIVNVKEDFWAGKVFVKKGFWLEHIFIKPEFIGRGVGTKLILFAKDLCLKKKIDRLFIFSDPHAKGFHSKMGARYLAEYPSSIEGRTVSLYELAIQLGGKQMKTIGLIGGMSWESTSEYYRIINEEVKERLGGLHSAKCILYSVDFEEIEICQRNGEWEKAARILTDAACGLEAAGADFIIICTNTMHKIANEIQAGIHIPLLHIADITAQRVLSDGIRTVGLLGTRYTMEEDFYKNRLEDQGIMVLVPEETDRVIVNNVIYQELCLGQISEESRAGYKRIIEALVQKGAEGIILGCTEIGLLVKPGDATVPLFDTTALHATGAVDFALDKSR